MKDRQHNLRMKAEEQAVLEFVAERHRRNKSDLLLFLLYQEHARIIAKDKRERRAARS